MSYLCTPLSEITSTSEIEQRYTHLYQQMRQLANNRRTEREAMGLTARHKV